MQGGMEGHIIIFSFLLLAISIKAISFSEIIIVW